ncbi:MAG: flippase [Fibrobacterota bacterium]|nr:flippase [Fibrobacterota bacterium]
MSAPPSLRRNFALNVALSVLNIAYPVATLVYVSRIVGPALLGRYYIAVSLAGYFLILAGMGIPLYGAREVARRRHDADGLSRLFNELFFLNAVSTLVFFMAYLAVVAAVPDLRRDLPLFSITGCLILLNAFATDWLFTGLEDFRNIAMRNVAARLVGLAMMFILVRGPGDFLAFAAMGVAVSAVANGIGFFAAVRRMGLRLRGLRLHAHLRPLLMLSAILMVTAFYTNLDSVILGLMAGDREAGNYNAGLRISKILVTMVTSIGVVLIPRLTGYLSQGRDAEFFSLSRKSLDLICFLAFPAMVLLWSASDGISALAFGPEFHGASEIMRITAPLIIVIGFTNCLGMQMLFPKGEEKLLFASMAAAAAVNLALNLALIPPFGAEGAAVATLAAETMVLIVQASFAWKRHGLASMIDSRMALYAGASLLAGVPFLAPWPEGMPILLRLAAACLAGGILYLACLALCKDPITRELLGRVTGTQRRRNQRSSNSP